MHVKRADWPPVVFSLQPILSPQTIAGIWQPLAANSGSFFLSWTWIGTWLEAIRPSCSPLLLIASRGDEVVAAATLVPRKHRRYGLFDSNAIHLNSTGEPSLDCIMIEHNGFVGLSSPTELLPALASWFSAGHLDADELFVPGIEQAAAKEIVDGRLLRSCRSVAAFCAPLDDLHGRNFEETLSRNARQQLRRSKRQYHEYGDLQIEEATTAESALAYFEELKLLHMRSWNRRGKPHAFRYPFFEQFHRALILRGMPERSVQLLRVTAGSRTVGYLYNFRHRGKIYAYQSGFEDSISTLRPGYVCHGLALERAAQEGADEYDFLAGSNRLKQSFGAKRYELSWCKLQQPKLKFRVAAAARLVKKMAAGFCS